MTDVRVVGVDEPATRADAFDVRQTVFVEEQGVDEDLEYDAHDEPDASADHFVAYDGEGEGTTGEPVGAARLREYDSGIGKVERVAVLESHREAGVGRALMAAVETQARERGFESLKLHSQTRAAPFYDRLGYDRHGEKFEEAGIPHVEMRKSLSTD
ncbi:GNAT family N-acetyltransferase [Natronolimnobius baerhuensis]|uniref:GNAT family N-acetyltransferase n=1 Tax=Natronolimnobius baerhuensis TaxID=253108 RepID=A0A202E6S3_9EURY|nr:GNAT family N-acetyltransferase [Natronolimnobius baerhuensis]OVE83959.1 GNAT family N-acetyltransferase [Natronolimnobius baerhuensis]